MDTNPALFVFTKYTNGEWRVKHSQGGIVFSLVRIRTGTDTTILITTEDTHTGRVFGGGFAISVESSPEGYLPPGRYRAVLVTELSAHKDEGKTYPATRHVVWAEFVVEE